MNEAQMRKDRQSKETLNQVQQQEERVVIANNSKKTSPAELEREGLELEPPFYEIGVLGCSGSRMRELR